MQRKQRQIQYGQWTVATVAIGLFAVACMLVTRQSGYSRNTVTALNVAPQEVQGQYTILLRSQLPVIAMNDGKSEISAQVRTAEGLPAADVNVQFSAQIFGSMASQSVQTDSEGIARSVFNAGSQPGQAVIQASTGDSNAITYVEIRDNQSSNLEAPIISVQLDALSLKSGQSAQVVVVVKDHAGQPLANTPVTVFGSLGTIEVASMVTDSSGRATTTFKAGVASGQATITALVGYGSGSKAQLQVIGQPLATSTPVSSADRVYLPLVSLIMAIVFKKELHP